MCQWGVPFTNSVHEYRPRMKTRMHESTMLRVGSFPPVWLLQEFMPFYLQENASCPCVEPT